MHYFVNMPPGRSKNLTIVAKATYYLPLFIITLVITLAVFSPLAHSKNVEQTLTLSSAIARTLEDNPQLKVFSFREQALLGKQQTQALKPRYELDFEAENFTGTGDIGTFKSAEYTLSLSSILEMGGKRNARIGVAKSQLDQVEAKRKITALNLLSEVTRRYIDVIAAQERLLLANQATLLAKETLQEVKNRSKAGVTPEAEVKRAIAALEHAKLIASSEQQQLHYSKMTLAMMWRETSPSFTRVEGNY